MEIGVNALGGTLERVIEDAQRAEAAGFDAYSMANISGHDAAAALALAGRETERIKLLTAVVPIYTRHPSTMAQQALTTQAAAGGRFTLGIGLGHLVSVEGRLGISFDRPAVAMREYLSVLLPALRGEPVEFEGERYTFRGQISARDQAPVPVVIAAMAPVMLRLAGSMADGTILWMAGAHAIDSFVAPRLRRAATEAGRPDPQVIASLPVALVSDETKGREAANEQFVNYGRLPSYRAMLDAQGAETPGDAALVGGEAALDAALRELEEAGVTQFNGLVFDGGQDATGRTRAYLESRVTSVV
ncbi:MAG: TIGR03564 family F420-dependent LLM class oxidoreductase [Dehalococcoidia bacterium]|nr:TIGR03564 family F420-dependent LLM class oxidoreductase [Dehalococcoidia bacterium]